MRKSDYPKTALLLGVAILGYFLFITLVITLLPFRFVWPSRLVIIWVGPPFDIIANVFLFFPIGFLLQLTLRRTQDRLCLAALAFGLSVSFVVEVAQFFLTGRYTSLTDLLANGIGAWAGAVLFERVNKQLNQKLAGQLALDLPLMILFYLLVPLLWLGGIGAGQELSRLWLTPILGLFGGIILVSVWVHRLGPAGILSPNSLALVVGGWFFVAAIPGLIRQPMLFIISGFGIVAIVRLLVVFPSVFNRADRRFELPTLQRIWPLYAIYLLLLALWPWPWIPASWEGSLGFANIGADPGKIPALRLVEYVAAFSVLGYMVAESRARRDTLLRHLMKPVVLWCIVSGGLLELTRGFHPKHVASLAQFVMAVGSGVYGGAVYCLQLMVVQRFRQDP